MADHRADYAQHAEMMEAVWPIINGAFADPGSKDAHKARCRAALEIHHGSSITWAVTAALPAGAA